MKILLLVLILWTETLADQSPGISTFYVYCHLGKRDIFMPSHLFYYIKTNYLFTKKIKVDSIEL